MNNFLQMLDGDYGEMPPALDVEDTTTNPKENDIRAWLEVVESETGKRPAIYSAAWYFDSYFPVRVDWVSNYCLWVASYNNIAPDLPEEWDEWWLWQYTATGDGPTYGAKSDDIDLNRFNDAERRSGGMFVG